MSEPQTNIEQIAVLEDLLGQRLLPSVVEVYRRNSKVSNTVNHPLRLMSLTEVRETMDDLRGLVPGMNHACAFWTDDCSNYAVVYLHGPLKGRVAYLNHDDPDLSPLFCSVGSFVSGLDQAAASDKSWTEMPTDYPTAQYGTFKVDPVRSSTDDLTAIADLRVLVANEPLDEDERRNWLCSIMALTPGGHVSDLMSYLSDSDMWVQARACELLGLWRYDAAVNALFEVACHGMHNGKTAAILALGTIGTADCLTHLLAIAKAPDGRAPIVLRALERCGCPVDIRKRKYQLPGTQEWHQL